MLKWTLTTLLPFVVIVESIIVAITFWKYHANMIILCEIQYGKPTSKSKSFDLD
jgi:hypothetical protein